jgi:hypothetical protein
VLEPAGQATRPRLHYVRRWYDAEGAHVLQEVLLPLDAVQRLPFRRRQVRHGQTDAGRKLEL